MRLKQVQLLLSLWTKTSVWFLGRVLLWRRSDNICIVLLLSGAKDVAIGHRVATKIKAILQVGRVSNLSPWDC